MRPPAAPDSPAPGTEPGAGVVAAALAALRPEHFRVIDCTFYRGLPADAAAARLGVSVETVKRRACRALQELRQILEDLGVRVPRGLAR